MLDESLAIGRSDATLEDYRAHLLLLRAWLAPLQAWLSTFQDGPQTLPSKDRLRVIEDDLGMCEILPHIGSGQFAQLRDRPWTGDARAAYRWGVCYVIEGSQLGGAVLYQRLKDGLAPHPLNYLRGESEGPGPRWRMFMQAIKAEVITQSDIEVACRGACDAFDRVLVLGQGVNSI